ncbi:MAG: hypothetical protein GEU83_01785 [Pseudonocardiaceae bacterium]|nr:hypothetical protein [Pseudonocardiaceae bacterium]
MSFAYSSVSSRPCRRATSPAVLLAAVLVGAMVTDLFVLGASPLPALVLLVVTAVIAWGRRDRIRTALGR